MEYPNADSVPSFRQNPTPESLHSSMLPFPNGHSRNDNLELRSSTQSFLSFSGEQDPAHEPSNNELIAGFLNSRDQYQQTSQPDNAAMFQFDESGSLLNFDDYLEDLVLLPSPLTPGRLAPDVTAVLLGIPEDNGFENSALQRDASVNSHISDQSLSEGNAVASPTTLRSANTFSSSTLPSLQQQSDVITLPPPPPGFSHTRLVVSLSEGNNTVTSPMTLRSANTFSSSTLPSLQQQSDVLTLLPPPPGFSHTRLVVHLPILLTSKTAEKAWKEASDAKTEGEHRLACAIPGLVPIHAVQNANSKRPRSPMEAAMGPVSNKEENRANQLRTAEADIQVVGGIRVDMTTPRKKRGKLNAQQRVEVAEIRKLGACLRCGIHKMKCSKDVPCDRCLSLARNAKMTINIPCWRSKLSAIELYRRRTQHGLFVYTYTKDGGDMLETRTLRIIDRISLEKSEHMRFPIPFQQDFSINSGSVLQHLSRHIVLFRGKDGSYCPYNCTLEQLTKGHVISAYLDIQMKSVLQTLGTSHQFVRLTLDVAENYSSARNRQLLRNSLRIFTARFLRRKFWASMPDDKSYDVAWMDVPWRALPVLPPKTPEEAEELNKILKDYLFSLERSILRKFKAKVYDRKREDWFELFLVTFIFQVVLSEKLEMSFYYDVGGIGKPLEMPWSTFGGLRSYSSQEIAAHFRAINGSKPFNMSEKERMELGELGAAENNYLKECPNLLKESSRNGNDLGSRRSSSTGHDGTPGSWWHWALETVLGPDIPD